MSLVEATWDDCECNVEKGLRSFVLSLIRTYLGWFTLQVRTESGRFVLTDQANLCSPHVIMIVHTTKCWKRRKQGENDIRYRKMVSTNRRSCERTGPAIWVIRINLSEYETTGFR